MKRHVGYPGGHQGEGVDQQIVALVAGEPAQGKNDAPLEAKARSQRVAGGDTDGEEAIVIVSRRDHRDLFGGRAVVLHDHVHLIGRGGDDLLATAEQQGLFVDSLRKIVFLFEVLRVLGRVLLHQLLFPEPERVRRVDMRHVQHLGQALRGISSIPIVTIEKLVLNSLLLDEAKHALGPLRQMTDEVLLVDEVGASTGGANDTYALIDHIDLGLVLEATRPDVHLEAELGQLLGEFEHIDHLAAGVSLSQRGVGRDITVSGNHTNARERRLRKNERHD